MENSFLYQNVPFFYTVLAMAIVLIIGLTYKSIKKGIKVW
jgi:hypothetical protein